MKWNPARILGLTGTFCGLVALAAGIVLKQTVVDPSASGLVAAYAVAFGAILWLMPARRIGISLTLLWLLAVAGAAWTLKSVTPDLFLLALGSVLAGTIAFLAILVPAGIISLVILTAGGYLKH